MKLHLLGACAFTALSASVLAQGGKLPFDLEDISIPGHPENPGVSFERHPVSVFGAEMGGMAMIDVNNDGWLDLFIADTENWPNHLYMNDGDGTFTERAVEFGVDEPEKRRGSVLFFDMENDGDVDLLTLGYPSQVILNLDLYTLYRNNGAPSYDFTDVTQSAGGFVHAPTPEPSLIGEPGGVASGDLDGNGFADLFITWWNRSVGYLNDQPRIWRNFENPNAQLPGQADYSKRIFSDFTVQSGMALPIAGWIWTPSLMDYDRDGDLDLHINIDFGFDILRLNDGTGVFGPNVSLEVGHDGAPAEARNEMGIAYGDIDFDGDMDTYHTNAYENDRQYLNETDATYGGSGIEMVDIAPLTGTDENDFGWGTAYIDMDNDQDLDLIRAAGMLVTFDNGYFENQWPVTLPGSSVPDFIDRSAELVDWHRPAGIGDIARSLIPADIDRDGDLDIIVGRYGESSFVTPGPRRGTAVYRNTLNSPNGWSMVELRERSGSRNVTGSRVFLRAGDTIMMRTVFMGGTSFMSQVPDRVHFGLGLDDIRWIAVRWFDKGAQSMLTPSTNTEILFARSSNDELGDVNGDNKVDNGDMVDLLRAIENPDKYDNRFGWWPWQVLGDMDSNGTIEKHDADLLKAKLISPPLSHN